MFTVTFHYYAIAFEALLHVVEIFRHSIPTVVSSVNALLA